MDLLEIRPSPPARRPIRLLLVDDHPLVRDGLRVRLQAAPGLDVVAEADGALAALDMVALHRPDLVLMDVGMRGINGIEATRRILAAACAAAVEAPRVLVLSMFDNPEYVREALRAGACGYVLKDSPADEVVQAIHAVMAGATVAPEALAAAPVPHPDHTAGAALTPREKEVLALIAEGLSSRDIGLRLGMGVRTVETHRTHLRRKLVLGSPAALVRFAVERSWATSLGPR